MKAKLFLPLILALSLCAFAQQESPKPKRTPDKQSEPEGLDLTRKSADPFLRSGAPAAPRQSPQSPSNIYGLVEYIEVPREAWLEYSMAHPLRHDATALRAEVQSWITVGKAKPIELTCVPTKSGQRTVVESIIERRYPSEYYQTSPIPVPSSFETRNTHFTFEWEPVLGPDSRTLDSSFRPQINRLASSTFNTPLERKFAQPGDAGQPLIATQIATLSMTSQPSQPVLLDVATPFEDNGKPRDEVRWLLFFRGAPVPLVPGEGGMPEQTVEIDVGESRVKMTRKQLDDLLNDRSDDPRTVRRRTSARKQVDEGRANFSHLEFTFEIERLEVSLADLNGWFADKDLEAATNGLRQSALDWIKKGRGREVDRRVGPVRSGQRMVWESIFEYRYPTEYGYDPIVAPTSFETRNTGYTVELEPIVDPDGKFVGVSMVPQDVRHCGNVVVRRTQMDGKMVPEIEQPIFATMRIITSIITATGKHSLLGITTPADDKMQPDPKRRILTFITFRP